MSDERKPMANIAPFGLRMQPDLKARVEDAARDNNRSLNAEIVARLEESLDSSVFETAIQQNKTLQLQGETIDQQLQVLKLQSTTLGQMKTSIDNLNKNLAAFAFAIQEAADGDMTAIKHFIGLAKKQPLRPSLHKYVIDPDFDPENKKRVK